MSTETALTDDDVASLVALADAATRGWEAETADNWYPPDPRNWVAADHWVTPIRKADAAFIAAANPATIKALAARLDALHAENQRLRERGDNEARLRELGKATRSEYALNRLRAERDREQKLRIALTTRVGEAQAERDALHAKLRAREDDVDRLIDERDALRDTITTLADDIDAVLKMRPKVGTSGERRAAALLSGDLRALLSEAGEPNE